MDNVAPSRSLARNARRLLLTAYVLVALGLFTAAIGLLLYLVPLVTQTSPQFALLSVLRFFLLLLGGGFALAGLALLVRALTLRPDNDLAERVGQLLGQSLDGRYSFIRNINTANFLLDSLFTRYVLRRAKLGYIDAVLVGPPGVLVFRIVGSTGRFLNEGSGWLRQNRNGDFAPSRVNPTREAIDDVRDVRAYLTDRRREARLPDEVPVYGVVVFTSDPPATQIELRNPSVPVAHMSALVEALSGNYLAQQRITEEAARRVRDLLLEA